MRTVFYEEPGQMRLGEAPMPVPRKGEAPLRYPLDALIAEIEAAMQAGWTAVAGSAGTQ